MKKLRIVNNDSSSISIGYCDTNGELTTDTVSGRGSLTIEVMDNTLVFLYAYFLVDASPSTTGCLCENLQTISGSVRGWTVLPTSDECTLAVMVM